MTDRNYILYVASYGYDTDAAAADFSALKRVGEAARCERDLHNIIRAATLLVGLPVRTSR